MVTPVIQTARLTLGPLDMDHVTAFTAFVATDRSRHLGGPGDDPRDAWDSCLIQAGQWTVRGYGTFWLTDRATGRPAGRVGLWHPVDFDEPELSWVVYEAFEGKGYAAEAATAVIGWAAERGIGPLMSLIAPDNLRSAALARRLGAVAEAETTTPSGKPVIRWRHRGAGAAAC